MNSINSDNRRLHILLIGLSEKFAALPMATRVWMVAGFCLVMALLFFIIFFYAAQILLTQTSLAQDPHWLFPNASNIFKNIFQR